jgi:hypothetical protein
MPAGRSDAWACGGGDAASVARSDPAGATPQAATRMAMANATAKGIDLAFMLT